MIGVPSSLYSGRVPRLSVLNRQATSRRLKFEALIWSSGEYLLPRRSAVYIGHSPFLVLGKADGVWPDRFGMAQTAPATTSARRAVRNTIRMCAPMWSRNARLYQILCRAGKAWILDSRKSQ